MNTAALLDPAECPEPLRRWAETLVGRPVGKAGSRKGPRRIAGWRWDGVSNEVVVLVAPRGTALRRIPDAIWTEIRS